MTWSNTILVPKQKELSFIGFCLELTELIGDAELPLDFQGCTIKQLTSPLDDVFNPIKQCLLDIYKQCRCHSLNSTICPITTLDILGNRCYELKRRKSGVDVKDVDLLEHIGIYLVETHLKQVQETVKTTHSVVRLDWYRTRIANRSKR